MTTFKRSFNFNYSDNKELFNVVSKNVRKYRNQKNITQEQLALDIGMSYEYLRKFETFEGRKGISVPSLYKISIVLDTPMEKFLEDND